MSECLVCDGYASLSPECESRDISVLMELLKLCVKHTKELSELFNKLEKKEIERTVA